MGLESANIKENDKESIRKWHNILEKDLEPILTKAEKGLRKNLVWTSKLFKSI